MALRGAALGSPPALTSRALSTRPRPARVARPVRATASPKPGKSTSAARHERRRSYLVRQRQVQPQQAQCVNIEQAQRGQVGIVHKHPHCH